MVKLKAVEVKMEEGEGLRQKLNEILANCEKIKQLPPATKATVFMRKNLRQAIEDTKQEVKKAKEFVNGLGIIVAVAPSEKQKGKDGDEVPRLLIKSRLFYVDFIINKFTSNS